MKNEQVFRNPCVFVVRYRRSGMEFFRYKCFNTKESAKEFQQYIRVRIGDLKNNKVIRLRINV